MSLLIDFRDAVNPAGLLPTATHAVFYCDGAYENRAAVRARCPHAKLYAITTQGRTGHGIFACDSETGDLTVAGTMAWNAEQARLGVRPLVNYANQNRWLNEGLLAEVQAFEKTHGVVIEKWDADFDGIATLPAWADAKQYATGSVDLDVARANFFGDATPTPEPDHPHGVAHFRGTFDLASGEWTIHGVHWAGVHFAGPKRWASAEIQVGVGGDIAGKWRHAGLPYDAKPLGN